MTEPPVRAELPAVTARRIGPARRRAGDRARHAPRRPVRRAPARRHGRRGHQGGAAGQARPDARMGPGALPGRSLWWPVQSRNKKCITLEPALSRRARSSFSSSCGHRMSFRRTSGPARSSAGTWLRAARRGQPGHRARPHLRLRPDRPVRRACGLRVGRRGDGRAPVHQRLPGRAAAAHGNLAGRLTRRHVRHAGHPGSALPPRRAWRRARTGRSTSRSWRHRSRCSRAPCPNTTGSGSSASRPAPASRASPPRTSSSRATTSGS